MKTVTEALKGNSYPGRGIIIGKSDDSKYAVTAYFIMGRSENSRNRVFEENEFGGIRTRAFDESKLTDPSLIIYNAVSVIKNTTIVTNGDQTDTVYGYAERGESFEKALSTREFEPDAPNYTPRISGIIELDGKGDFSYKLSILKSDNGDPLCCCRYTFSYDCPVSGAGRLIHTYRHDGSPIPSYCGEPEAVSVGSDIDTFADELWQSLDSDNKVSLFVRYIDLATQKAETRIINKNVR